MVDISRYRQYGGFLDWPARQIPRTDNSNRSVKEDKPAQTGLILHARKAADWQDDPCSSHLICNGFSCRWEIEEDIVYKA